MHKRIIRGREYWYTTKWDGEKVVNVYLGAVDPKRIGSRSIKKRKHSSEVLRDAKLAERLKVNAALRTAESTTCVS